MEADTTPRPITNGDVAMVITLDDINYQLDSVVAYSATNNVWMANSKQIHSYTQNLNLDFSLYQRFDGFKWVNTKRDNIVITDGNAYEMRLEQVWDEGNATWINLRKRDFNDDNDNGLFDITYSEWGQNGAWDVIWRQSQTYMEQGKLLSYETEKWNSTNEKWESYWDYNCLYDNAGFLLQTTHRSYGLEADSWNDALESICEYENGRLKSEQIIDWNSEADAWENLQITEVTYPNANSVVRVKKSWSEEGWVNNMMVEESLDNKGNITQIYKYNWDSETTNWEFNQRTIYNYDSKGLKLSKETSSWSDTNSSWETNLKEDYHYSQQVPTKIEDDLNERDFSVYPNPVDSEMSLKFEGDAKRLSIYCLDGAKVLEQNIPITGQAINVNHLTPGIYVAVLHFEQGHSECKFVKN